MAHNSVLNADEFLLGQKVLFDRRTRTEDGKSNIVVIRDVETNIEREIEVDNLDIFTGPGEETLKNVDSKTRDLYAEELAKVEALIEKVAEMKRKGETIRPSIVVDALPRLLTLTIMEKLYGLWDNVLDREDEYWPFRNLVKAGVEVGGVGGKDTTRVLAEFCNQKGPREGYPSDLQSDEIPAMVLYNEKAKNKKEYDEATRARYENVWGPLTSAKDVKIDGAEIVPGGGRIRLRERNSTKYQDFDYAILSLGFEREDLVQQFDNAGILIKKLTDQAGNTVGLANRELGITIDGSATGFVKEDFPDSIAQIIDVLGIGENTVALWVYNLLSTRALWETGTASKKKITRLIGEYVEGRQLGGLRTMFKVVLGGSSRVKSPPANEVETGRRIGEMARSLRDAMAST